uniref:Uncharacterized protein n=1 Tax=Anguilla anguilla TaxID=7936 RepID=A0A0E9TUW1_ANGAN
MQRVDKKQQQNFLRHPVHIKSKKINSSMFFLKEVKFLIQLLNIYSTYMIPKVK